MKFISQPIFYSFSRSLFYDDARSLISCCCNSTGYRFLLTDAIQSNRKVNAMKIPEKDVHAVSWRWGNSIYQFSCDRQSKSRRRRKETCPTNRNLLFPFYSHFCAHIHLHALHNRHQHVFNREVNSINISENVEVKEWQKRNEAFFGYSVGYVYTNTKVAEKELKRMATVV